MRVLWISCLLIGSIICAPVEYDYGLDMEYGDMGPAPMQEGSLYDYSFQENADDPDNYDDATTLSAPAPRGYRSNKLAEGDWLHSDHTRGSGSAGWADPTPVTSVSSTSGGGNEPVFSDMSGQDPVYSSQSRSRYQKGSVVMVQTRYIPAGSHGLPVPQWAHTSIMYPTKGNQTPVKAS